MKPIAAVLALPLMLAVAPIPSSADTSTAGQATSAPAQSDTFEPQVGQQGKDVVWVPTSPELLELMLDLAEVGPNDFVMDLGSGDGRNVIAAARRGARGLGVEFNPDMVRLSRRLAQEAGVADRAQFVEGDMYEADVSRATVLALFLLPSNLEQLKDKFLAMPAGTRIVLNTFTFNDWEPDEQERLESGCTSWCAALLHIVPARVSGTWQFGDGSLVLEQEYQHVTGTLTRGTAAPLPVTGRLRGAEITLDVDGRTYTGLVDGTRMSATPGSPAWTATR